MSLSSYLSTIQLLRQSYLERNTSPKRNYWFKELERVSNHIKTDFDRELHPHFFSGDYLSKQIIGVTMNPKKRSIQQENVQISDSMEKFTFNEFLNRQKNRFFTFQQTSYVYQKFDKIISYLRSIITDFSTIHLNKELKYPLLAQYGAAIDLIPFYSDKFKIKLDDRSMKIFREYYDRIHKELFSTGKPNRIVLILNGQLTQALLKPYSDQGNTINPYTILAKNTLIGRWGTSTIYILEDNNRIGRIFAVSNWNQFVPNDLLKNYAKIIYQYIHRI